MLNFKMTLSVFAMILVSSGCANHPPVEETKQGQQAEEQMVAQKPQAAAVNVAAIFANAPDLTDEQKQKLQAIHANVYEEAMAIRGEINENRSLLYNTLVMSDYSSAEVNNLKKKIVSLDKKRLDVMFKALKDVQKIVGRGKDKVNIYGQLLDDEKR